MASARDRKENFLKDMADLAQDLHGIIVPLLTPLTEGRRVDKDSLRRLALRVVEGGVQGVFVMGTTGEFQYLPHEEQVLAIEAVCREVGGKALVVAGVTGTSIETTVRNITVVGNLSAAPHALVVAPLCYHSNRKLPQHMEQISAISRLPLLLYNNIGIVTHRWKRKDIIPDLMARIARLERVVGIKDSSGNIDYITRVLALRSPLFRVFQGDESLILASWERGAVGAVPSIGNILPTLCAKLYRAYQQGNREEAISLQGNLLEIRDTYFRYGNIPSVLKEYLVRQGVIRSAASFHPFLGDIHPVVDHLETKIRALMPDGALL